MSIGRFNNKYKLQGIIDETRFQDENHVKMRWNSNWNAQVFKDVPLRRHYGRRGFAERVTGARFPQEGQAASVANFYTRKR